MTANEPHEAVHVHLAQAIDHLLTQRPGARTALERALAIAPDHPRVHVALAALEALEGGASAAAAHAREARALIDAGGYAESDRAHVSLVVEALTAPRADLASRAARHLATSPGDLLVAGLLLAALPPGDSGAAAALCAVYRRMSPNLQGHSGFLGLFAFVLEENGEWGEAEVLAREALRLDPGNAQAAHVLAHVRYGRAEHAEGLAELDRWRSRYSAAPATAVHLAWHSALFRVELGDRTGALAIHRAHVEPAAARGGRDAIVDAASLLWRLAMRGEEHLPWSPLRGALGTAPSPDGSPFHDLHRAIVLAGANDHDALDCFMACIAETRGSDAPLLRVVRAFAAWSRGAREEAAALLQHSRGDWPRIGGSDAQRGLFDETIAAARPAPRARSARA